MPLVSRVRELRQERGVTQEALADAVGVSRQTVVAIERGNYTPSLQLGLDLARYFRVPVEQLFRVK